MSYLVELDLGKGAVLVIGGGRLAEAHTEQLLAAGGLPRIVAPETTTGLARMIEESALPWEKREFDESDLDAAWLVLALTADPVMNARICEAAQRRGRLVHGACDDGGGNFRLPPVLRRGSLAVAVSSRMPHLARQILLELEEDFGPEWTEYTRRLDALRSRIAAIPDELERQRVIHRVTSPAILGLVRAGDTAEWSETLREVASAIPEPSERI